MLSQLMWGNVPVYALCVTAAAVISLGVYAFCGVRAGLSRMTMLLQGVLSAALGYMGARTYYVLSFNVVGGYGLNRIDFFSAWPFEYAMCGAVLGVLLAGVISARATKQKLSYVMDAAALPGLCMLMLSRCAEVFSDFGWGKVLTDEAWQFFPYAVKDMFGQWHTAVFFLEALCALCVLIYAMKKPAGSGVRFAAALLWFSMTQIFCESLRIETIRWGFVRVQQVQCAVFGLALLIGYGIRRKLPMKQFALRMAVYVLGIGMLVLAEYALDKLPWPNWLCYALMAATLSVMGADVQGVVKE